jgi:hypothetical protein
MKHSIIGFISINIVIASLLLSIPVHTREICFSSNNSRGNSFFLHIDFDRSYTPKYIRYKGSKTAITLSYYGRQKIYLPDLGETRNATMYMENYKNSITGKLYILDTPLYNGIYIAFVRVKDGQFFYFNECN